MNYVRLPKVHRGTTVSKSHERIKTYLNTSVIGCQAKFVEFERIEITRVLEDYRRS